MSSQNKLINASSPYLLQHAHNPVDWFSWGEEAFRKAQSEDKPVFLSIGYSTCHWCHVMAHESFEDPKIAAAMNEAFINIKVDREQRPDIDRTYMLVCQMLTGSGGWPLNVWLTPQKKPFYASTYIPKSGRHGKPGMEDLIPRIAEFWQNERDQIQKSTQKISDAFQKSVQVEQGDYAGTEILQKAYKQYESRYDEQYGGFGTSPKFPSSHNLMLLLRYARQNKHSQALPMVQETLTQMRLGGLYDQIGFGFHRYSTDQQWLVPHFEKMLYDQAMMLMSYTEGWLATGSELFKQTGEEIIRYLKRQMCDEKGGYYSAEDADSDGEEGKFYTWTVEAVNRTLQGAEQNLFNQVFNIKEEGNYQEEATGRLTGRNIPHLSNTVEDLANERNEQPDVLAEKIEAIRGKLLQQRQQRNRPLLDDKILTDWNGLTIAALAKAGRAFDSDEYIEQAEQCYQFILKYMTDDDGRLLHRWRDGQAAINAYADDYSFLIWGLIELYEATFNARYLQAAVSLNKQFVQRCWDHQTGAFFTADNESEDLLARKKEFYDGALPSANSVAMLNLLRLGRMTGNTDWEDMADTLNKLFSTQMEKAPTGFGFAMQSILFTSHSREIIVVGEKKQQKTQEILSLLRHSFLPNAVVLFKSPEENDIADVAPFLTDFAMIDDQPTIYVCQNYECKKPVHTADELQKMIG